MNIIKRLFNFNDDESCAIGLCKFSEEFYKINESKEKIKKKIEKEISLTQILKRNELT